MDQHVSGTGANGSQGSANGSQGSANGRALTHTVAVLAAGVALVGAWGTTQVLANGTGSEGAPAAASASASPTSEGSGPGSEPSLTTSPEPAVPAEPSALSNAADSSPTQGSQSPASSPAPATTGAVQPSADPTAASGPSGTDVPASEAQQPEQEGGEQARSQPRFGEITLPDTTGSGVPDLLENKGFDTSNLQGVGRYTVYMIKPGDTLTQISARTGVPVGVLVSANHIEDPNLIYAGASLFIPIWHD